MPARLTRSSPCARPARTLISKDLTRHIWRICWIWRDALRDLAAHATLYFRLSIYNQHVATINVCDPLPARVLREAQEAGPRMLLSDPALSFNKMTQSSDCGEDSNSEGRFEVMRKNEEGKIGWILLWVLGIPLPILLILYVLRGCT